MIVVILLIIIASCLLFGGEATREGLNGCFMIGLILLVAFGLLASCSSLFN